MEKFVKRPAARTASGMPADVRNLLNREGFL